MRRKRLWNRLVLFASLAVVVLFAMGSSALAKNDAYGAEDDDFCTKTSKAAQRACRYEVNDDYWIAIGNCNNLSDADDRIECKVEAWAERREGMEECGDQYEARQEVCESLGESPYDPLIDPDDFVDPSKIGKKFDPNPYFPLTPGMTWVYEGGDEIITVTVTEDTKEILGVTCVVVRDVVQEDEEVIEDTNDWYAQDVHGNVWYLGEISQEFEDGELVSLEGSWKAGVDGAKPGILMKADPEVGDVYRQEFALGDAEDMGEVLSVTGTEEVPAASCDGDCRVTKDFTPLEPDAEENKYYAPGIGLILEVDPETGDRVELVEIEPEP